MAASSVFLTHGQTFPTNTVRVNPQTQTYLYGGQASKLEGDIKKRGGDNFGWKGSGAVSWEVQIAEAGQYAVTLCHAAEPGAAGQELKIASSGGQLNYTVRNTEGAFRGNMAYEMAPLTGSLSLAAGKQTITVSITNASVGKPLLAFRSLELIRLSAEAAIEADRQEARRSRASAEWLSKAGYGLMFHWRSQSIGTNGIIKPFDQAVADFPLDQFVGMVAATGAGYVLFTVGHAQPYCPAPLSSWEKYHPGKTTKRDLIAEMAQALNATKRIIAVNSWIYPNVTEWQDYWAGEVASPVKLPVNGTNERGPGQGL